MCVCVCVCVCPLAYLWNDKTNFYKILCTLHNMTVAQSSGGIAIDHQLPVLWMTSYLHALRHVDALAANDVIASS